MQVSFNNGFNSLSSGLGSQVMPWLNRYDRKNLFCLQRKKLVNLVAEIDINFHQCVKNCYMWHFSVHVVLITILVIV